FYFTATAHPTIYTLSLHDALPISHHHDFYGTEGACSLAAQELRKRRKDIGSGNETTCAHQAQDATEVELHAAANVKLFLRSSTSDRKSTRLNSSHVSISYAVFCLK